jgi:hypothetical protein
LDEDKVGQEAIRATLIVFAYAEGEYRNSNLEYFVKKGGIISSSRYYYVFIGSGVKWKKTKYYKWICRFKNTEMIERENTGFDSCGWKQVLRKYRHLYSRYILLNGSVRGPFLPVYASHIPWPEIFLRPFENGNPHKYGLSGTTINCNIDKIHVQSMLLAFTNATQDIIYNSLGCFRTKELAIDNGELNYSKQILEHGYNLYSLLKYWENHDFRNATATKLKCVDSPLDMLWPMQYKGMDVHPLELVFIKTNRGLSPVAIQRYSQWQKTRRNN